MDEEPIFIVCGPTGKPSVKGATIDLCHKCGATVTISPTGRLEATKPNRKLICMEDFFALTKSDADITIKPLTPEQITELIDNLSQ